MAVFLRRDKLLLLIASLLTTAPLRISVRKSSFLRITTTKRPIIRSGAILLYYRELVVGAPLGGFLCGLLRRCAEIA